MRTWCGVIGRPCDGKLPAVGSCKNNELQVNELVDLPAIDLLDSQPFTLLIEQSLDIIAFHSIWWPQEEACLLSSAEHSK
jgi:hypothetical protein